MYIMADDCVCVCVTVLSVMHGNLAVYMYFTLSVDSGWPPGQILGN